MNRFSQCAGRVVVLVIVAGSLTGGGDAFAQSPEGGSTSTPPKPARSSAQIEAGEPRANTSAAAGSSDDSPAPVRSNSATKAAPPTATGKTAAARSAGGNQAVGKQALPDPAGSGGKPHGGADRLDLGAATVTGDREQPKVMYIVPWKKSDIGDLSGKPMNSLLDEALAPVDRDEFKREVAYYDAVKSDAPQNGASKDHP